MALDNNSDDGKSVLVVIVLVLYNFVRVARRAIAAYSTVVGDATAGGRFVRTTDAFFDRDDRGVEAASSARSRALMMSRQPHKQIHNGFVVSSTMAYAMLLLGT